VGSSFSIVFIDRLKTPSVYWWLLVISFWFPSILGGYFLATGLYNISKSYFVQYFSCKNALMGL